MRQYFIYILECVNGGYYTGYTTDLARRYQEHQLGSIKCKYTRAFPPIQLCAGWVFSCALSDILRVEHLIKRLTKQNKQALIARPTELRFILEKAGLDALNYAVVYAEASDVY